MTDLLSITLPIFLIVALGFVAVRMRILSAEFIRGLGFFVLNFALPALVLHALTSQDFRTSFDWDYLAAYGLASLVVLAAVLYFFRFALRRDLTSSAIAALGGSASNSGFLGFPIASLALGTPALIALPLCMLVEVVLVIPLALGFAEAGRGDGQPVSIILRDTLQRLVRMPLLIAIIVGLALAGFGVSLPRALSTAIDMLADASAASALLVVGGALASVGREAFSVDIVWIALAKLVLHPLMVAAALVFLDVDPALAVAALIFASAPMMTSYPIFAQRFGLEGLAAAALIAATVTGFVTMTLILGLTARHVADARLTEPVPALQVHAHAMEDTDGR